MAHNFRTLREASNYLNRNNYNNAAIFIGNENIPVNKREYNIDLPNITVTPQKYASSFDGSLENFTNTINAMTGGISNRFDITQNARALYDTYKLATGDMSSQDYINSLVYGNNGIVSDKYAKDHPILSTLANIAGGTIGNLGIASSKLARLPFYNKTYTGVPDIVMGTGENMRDAFMKPKRNFNIWTADNPYYTQEFSKNYFNPKDNKVNKGIFTVFSLDKNNKVIKSPKLPKDVDEVSWKNLPYDFYDNKLKFMPDSKKETIVRTNIDPKTGYMIVDKNNNTTKNITIYRSNINDNFINDVGDNTTDYIINRAIDRGYNTIKLNKVMDGPWSNKYGVTEYKPINEIIYSKDANIIKIPGYRNKVDLAKYLINNTDLAPALYNSVYNVLTNINRTHNNRKSRKYNGLIRRYIE